MGGSKSKEKSPKRSPQARPVAKADKSTITSSDKAKLQLKMQRDNLMASIRKYERVAAVEHEKALAFMRSGDRRRALYCVKREKMQQNQVQAVTDMLDNVQTLINTVEFAQIEMEVVGALKDGKTELERLNKMLNIEDIEKLMDETAEAVEEARQIDAVLSQNIAGYEDDEELLAELMEATGAKEDNTISDVKVPTHDMPTKTKVEAQSSEKGEREEETNHGGRELVGA